MFDHVTIRVSDREASERFYDTVLAAIGVEKGYSEDWLAEWGDFSISPANAEHPLTRGLHMGVAAGSRERVDRFWRVGTEAGYRDDGSPGLRPQYRHDYYGAFLLDPEATAWRPSSTASHPRPGSTTCGSGWATSRRRRASTRRSRRTPGSGLPTARPGCSSSRVRSGPSRSLMTTDAAYVLDPDGNNVEVVSHNR